MQTEGSCGTTHTRIAGTDLCPSYRPSSSIDINSLWGRTVRHIAHVPSTHLSQLRPAGSLESVWLDEQGEPTIKHESDDVKNAQGNLM